MKTFFLALVIAILIAGPLAVPAAAYGPCGVEYTVQFADSLYGIADKCEVTLAEILSLNPEITNPSLIYLGQVIRLPAASEANDQEKPASSGEETSPTFTVHTGDSLYDIAMMFEVKVREIQAANPDIEDAWIYPGDVIIIPPAHPNGEPTVGLSATVATRTEYVTAYARGFPPGAPIDYRLGRVGMEYSKVYDGVVGPDGTASLSIPIPNDAYSGEYWYVRVTTTGQMEGTEAISYRIRISSN